MSKFIRLPNAEFEIMEVIWSQPSPISSVQVFEWMKPVQNWTPQTVLTLLLRLTKKGFLSTQKQGRERYYTPLITREDYLNSETGHFMKKFHNNSITGLMNALYADKAPNDEDLNELEQWLKERRD